MDRDVDARDPLSRVRHCERTREEWLLHAGPRQEEQEEEEEKGGGASAGATRSSSASVGRRDDPANVERYVDGAHVGERQSDGGRDAHRRGEDDAGVQEEASPHADVLCEMDNARRREESGRARPRAGGEKVSWHHGTVRERVAEPVQTDRRDDRREVVRDGDGDHRSFPPPPKKMRAERVRLRARDDGARVCAARGHPDPLSKMPGRSASPLLLLLLVCAPSFSPSGAAAFKVGASWKKEAEKKHGRVAMLAVPALVAIGASGAAEEPVRWLSQQPVDAQALFFSAAGIVEAGTGLPRLGYNFTIKEGILPGVYTPFPPPGPRLDAAETLVGRVAMLVATAMLVQGVFFA